MFKALSQTHAASAVYSALKNKGSLLLHTARHAGHSFTAMAGAVSLAATCIRSGKRNAASLAAFDSFGKSLESRYAKLTPLSEAEIMSMFDPMREHFGTKHTA